MTESIRDKHGREIMEFDVIKVFHFVGARRKRHYMYKHVIRLGDRLYGNHLQGDSGLSGSYYLAGSAPADSMEIVQGFGPDKKHDFEDRPKVKP